MTDSFRFERSFQNEEFILHDENDKHPHDRHVQLDVTQAQVEFLWSLVRSQVQGVARHHDRRPEIWGDDDIEQVFNALSAELVP